MELWINNDPVPNSPAALQEVNNAAYRRLIPELRSQFAGKWGVIAKGDLNGIYETKQGALEAISQLNPEPHLIFPIKEEDKIRVVSLGMRRRTSG